MKKSIMLAVCIMLLVAGSAFAQSAKFAATWNQDAKIGSVYVIEEDLLNYPFDEILVDSNAGTTLATIHVPNKKELLVGVSAEISIVTETRVKGKNGGSISAEAGAGAYVTVFAVPSGDTVAADSLKAAPGAITLSSRVQALSATLGGVIESCTLDCSLNNNDTEDPSDDYVTCEDMVIAEDCVVSQEEIGLLLDTTAANHFNFVFPDLPQGTYDVVAVFTTGANAEVAGVCAADDDACNNMYALEAAAGAAAIINKTMVTVQEVRAVQDEFIEVE